MGLLMYRDPDEVDVKHAKKNDPTAAARSSIRRQRTVRGSPSSRPRTSTALFSPHSRPSSNHGRVRMPYQPQSFAFSPDTRPSARPNTDHIPQMALDQMEMLGKIWRKVSRYGLDFGHDDPSQRFRADALGHRMRVTVSYTGRPGRVLLIRYNASTPRTTTHVVSDPPWPSNSSALPPDSSNAQPERSVDDAGLFDTDPVHLTPGFPPAHQSSLSGRSGERAPSEDNNILDEMTVCVPERAAWFNFMVRNLPLLKECLADRGDRNFIDHVLHRILYYRALNPVPTGAEHWRGEVSEFDVYNRRVMELARDYLNITRYTFGLPDLTRPPTTSDLFNRPSPPEDDSVGRGGEVDGLGDRERSFSPDFEAWENLLLTIPPDVRMPSTQSSFTSATASASANSSQSSLPATLMTAPSSNSDDLATIDDDEDDFCPDLAAEGRRIERDLTATLGDDAVVHMDLSASGNLRNDSSGNRQISGYGTISPLPHSTRDDETDRNESATIHEQNIARMNTIARRLDAHRARLGETPHLVTLREREQELRSLENGFQRLQEDIVRDRVAAGLLSPDAILAPRNTAGTGTGSGSSRREDNRPTPNL